jgi:hypothetical protein
MHLVLDAIRVIGETHSYLGGIAGGLIGFFALTPQCPTLTNILAGGSSECHNALGPATTEWFWLEVAACIVVGCAIQVGVVSGLKKSR